MIEINFIELPIGAIFRFFGNNNDIIRTWNFYTKEWIVLKDNNNCYLMNMDNCSIYAYTKKSFKEVEESLKEECNQCFKEIYKSINEGYLTIGFYNDSGIISDYCGYIHSNFPIYPYHIDAKFTSPSWYNLKAFS